MLHIKRKPGEQIAINGGEIMVTVLKTARGHVVLGFDAPQHIKINWVNGNTDGQHDAPTTEVATPEVEVA